MAPPAGAALPAAALYGQGRDRRPRCCPERGTHPGPPRASLGRLTCASARAMAPGTEGISPSSWGRPGTLLPGAGALVGGLSRPFSRRPSSGQRSPCLGAAPTAVPALRSPPRRDRRHPSVGPPAPAPLGGIPGTWQGAEQAAGGGEVEQGAPRPLHAGPIRAGSAGGTGAVPGRAGGRGGAGGTWSSPSPGGAGRGVQLLAPTLPARYSTSPCRIARSRSSPDSDPGTLGSVRFAPPTASPIGPRHPGFGQDTLGTVRHRPWHPQSGHSWFGQDTPGTVFLCSGNT